MKRYAVTELARNVTVAARGLASRRVDYLSSVRIDTRTNCGGGMLDMRAGWLPAKKAAQYCRVAPSHFRNFKDKWEIFHNSVKFESIFDVSSPCSSELKVQVDNGLQQKISK
jgi:hypothetical protein